MSPTTRPSSLGRLFCKPPVAIFNHFEITVCLGRLVKFALDDGHGPLVDREARGVTPLLCQDLQVHLLERQQVGAFTG